MNDSVVAVVADVHGNSWALRAVLEDIERRGIPTVVNLGDCFYGPLDPGGTFELLRGRSWATVCGNQDRILEEEVVGDGAGATLAFVLDELGDVGLGWARMGMVPSFVLGGFLFCHGTPDRDDEYLAEVVTPRGVELRSPEGLDEALGDAGVRGVVCAHSHVPRLLRARSGRWVANPGSVGLPAYEADSPYLHAMEAGSPHARYALLEGEGEDVRVSFVAVPYDMESAARAAQDRGRPDWSTWLRTGRARLPT